MKRIFNLMSLLLMISAMFTSCGKEEEKISDNANRKDYPNGDYYIGQLNEAGEPNGKGTYYWASGDRYEGDFVNGNRTGKGIYYWPNGNRYEGDFVNGNRTGKGIYYWLDGDRYEGDFVDNVRIGKGTYYWASGNRYEGDWVAGDMTGKGILYWASGDRYEGDFAAGARTGTGKMTWKDGTAITCQWENGTPVNTDNKTFVVWAIKYWYYWNNQVGVINPDYYQSASALLESVKYKDDIRSMVYDIDAPDDIFFYGKEIGYGLGIRWNENNDLLVAYVYPNSPAAKQGITRGCRIAEINGVSTSTQNVGSMTANEVGKSVKILFYSLTKDGISEGIFATLVSDKYDITSVLYKEVIQTPSKKVGYIVLKSCIEANETEIKNAITTLTNGNIQELILDLRYCAGGNYEVLRKTASLFAPTAADGKVLLTRKYNQDRQSSNSDYLIEKSNSLNLNRIIVLTSTSTYSLGEYLIIGLQPYCDVVLIGSKTNGTDAYGQSSWTLPDKKEIIQLTTALFENSVGKNSIGGLEPGYSVADGLDRNWGDRQENLLQNALNFIENGQILKSSWLRAQSQYALPAIPEKYSPVETLPVPEEIINALKTRL